MIFGKKNALRFVFALLIFASMIFSSCDFLDAAVRAGTDSWEFRNESSKTVQVTPKGSASSGVFSLEPGEKKSVSFDDDELSYSYSPITLCASSDGISRIVRFTDK